MPSRLPVLLLAAICTALLIAPGAFADEAVSCNVQGYDLSVIPQASLQILQEYKSATQMYSWVVNLCQPVSAPPSGQPPCTVPGYITEYSTSHCETAWNSVTSATAGTNSLVMVFGQSGSANHLQWTATVTLTCGGTSPDLVSTGNVMVTGPSTNQLDFAFAFTTNAVCGTTPPPGPGPTPSPPGPGPTPSPPGPNPTPSPPGPNPTPSPPAPNPNPTPPQESAPACSGGCAFTIVVFLGGGLYVAITVAYYYFRVGKRGMELLPHPEFWKEFGLCVKDGVIFSVQKIRALVCKSGPYADTSGGYQAV